MWNRQNAVARFWSYVDMSGGPDACWPWTRSVNRSGYGQFLWEGVMQTAHRVAYKIHHGSIPADKPNICHECDNRLCCNPKHLRADTHQGNMRDVAASGVHRGRKNASTILTEEQVTTARYWYATTNKATINILADYFHVTPGCMHNALTGRTWQYLPGAVKIRKEGSLDASIVT